MFPDLIDLGFIHLKTYGACMAVGFLLCWNLIERLSGRKDLSNLLLSLMVSGVVGSRIAYVIEHWQAEFAAHPAQIVRVDQGGLMFYGGLILALAVFGVWCAVKRENPLKLADLLATVIPLGHACGRIGCFFYGCCYGRLSNSAFAVSFPAHSPAWYEQFHAGLIPASAPASLPVLPTQLVEAAALLVLFGVLLFARLKVSRADAEARRDLGNGFVSGLYLAGYAVLRFGIEYLRGDPRAVIGPFSISQTISLALLAFGAFLLVRSRLSFHKRHLIALSVLLFLALSAAAERQPFKTYQPIVDRQMFGPPPEGFDRTKPASAAVSSREAEKKAQELAKEQEKIKSAIRFSMINVTPSGETAVGFTDSSDPKNPRNYYLKKGESSSQGEWTVKEADPAASSMTIVSKDGIEVSLTIGGDSAKGAGQTSASHAPAAQTAPPFGGGLRAGRSHAAEFSLGAKRKVKQNQVQQAMMAEITDLKKMVSEQNDAAEKRHKEDLNRILDAEREKHEAEMKEMRDELNRKNEERKEKTREEEAKTEATGKADDSENTDNTENADNTDTTDNTGKETPENQQED